jgi:hypothetical protein
MSSATALGLHRREQVTVRPAEEIVATLDEDAGLDGLPFMPEMLQFCGRSFTVYRRADKTCDTIEGKGLRRMSETVHLDALRCDGSAHGGCQAGCLLFWKEAWLTRDSAGPPATDPAPEPATALSQDGAELLARATQDRRAMEEGSRGTTRFSCQATQLLEATAPLDWRDPRQYVRDLRTGNVRFFRLVRGLTVFMFNKYQGFSKRFLPAWLRIREGKWYPFVFGKLKRTPTEVLDLRPGELVEVKSKADILATLDAQGRNRGLRFDSEMLHYCGRRYRVERRVERILDERTGGMILLPRDCIVLEGAACRSDYHRFCPRSIPHYWREIWLKRVD